MTGISSGFMLGPGSTPVLAADTVLTMTADALVIETPAETLTVGGERLKAFSDLLRGLDGGTSLAQLAGECDVEPDSLFRALEQLADSGALIDVTTDSAALGDAEFLDAILLECRLRTRALFEQSFWRKVRSGQASREVILGWGIEFAHFVDAANVYMPLGIAHCRSGHAVCEIFSRHYVEEAEHAEFFLAGLQGCGLDRQQIERAPPLASTRALINLLSECAITGAAPFAACFAVMQPSQEPTDIHQIRAFYAELRAFYPYAAPLFDAFEQHALVDVELAHEITLLERLCQVQGIAAADRARVIEVVHSLVEAFALFFEGIADGYGTPGAALPRRPVIARLTG